MNSLKKPPLPKAHIIGMQPEIFCLSFKQQKICDDFNKKQDEIADQEFKNVEWRLLHGKKPKLSKILFLLVLLIHNI